MFEGVKTFLAGFGARQDFAAKGRPRAIEGEEMVVGTDLLASMAQIGKDGVFFLPTDDIVARHGWTIYKEMVHDDQVKAALEFKKILIAGRTWELDPADKSPEAKEQAEFLTDAMQGIKMNYVFKEALSALEFGFSLAEQVFERGDWHGKQMVLLKKIAHRDPFGIWMKMDVHGNWFGARQQVTYQVKELPKEKLWLFTHDPRFGNVYGSSDLRAAYRSWYAKKFVVQFWNVFLERLGSPMMMMKYPVGASDQLRNTLKKILTNLSSKTEILVPEGVQVQLVEATRGGTATYEQALAFHNNSISRAILMAGLLGIDGDATRTNAATSQSFLQLRILFKMADEVSQRLAESFMSQIGRPLLDMNYEKPLYPTFIWQDYGQFEGTVVADEIRQLHANGVIDMDQSDVNYVRSILGLRVRDPLDPQDEVIRPQPLPPPGGGAAQPPAAPGGNDRAGKGGATQKDKL